MKTFNNNTKLKDELLEIIKEHQTLDNFIQGKWLHEKEGNQPLRKGCQFGCIMQTKDNPLNAFSEKYQIPLWYVYVAERVFEGLSVEDSKTFVYDSILAIPVGIDMYKERSKFQYNLLEDQLQFCKEDEKTTKSIKLCMELFKVPFNEICSSAAAAAAWSAWSAESAASAASASAASASAASAASASAAGYSAIKSILINSLK